MRTPLNSGVGMCTPLNSHVHIEFHLNKNYIDIASFSDRQSRQKKNLVYAFGTGRT